MSDADGDTREVTASDADGARREGTARTGGEETEGKSTKRDNAARVSCSLQYLPSPSRRRSDDVTAHAAVALEILKSADRINLHSSVGVCVLRGKCFPLQMTANIGQIDIRHRADRYTTITAIK